MDEIELKQSADFLSIALEAIDSGSYDVAIDFVSDTAENIEDDSLAQKLHEAVDEIEFDHIEYGTELIEDVYSSILERIDQNH